MNLEPGKAIGIIAAQSIASSLTQIILNQFHSCGSNVSTITKGVPRLLELTNLTQKPSQITYMVSCNEEITDNNKLLPARTCKTLITSYDYSVRPKWITFAPYNLSLNGNLGIVLNLDVKELCKNRITPNNILSVLQQQTDIIECVINPLYQIFISSTNLEELENVYLPQLINIKLYGIENIALVEPIEERKIALIGCKNAPDILLTLIKIPCVIPTQSWSNNIWTTVSTLGVDAALSFMFMELKTILDSSLYNLHIELLINQMCWTGKPQSLSRYSLRDDISSVFTKVSFEESMLNFLNATFRNETDSLIDVSSCIVVGKRIKVGTGFFQLLHGDLFP